ncbi:MAG: TolC family protein [Lentisphaeria bacterium]|nr:TolC family protein [Lentisphaeria bacterium]NQZ68725.1 TolC family protein [Lentisphaeria bacterium]
MKIILLWLCLSASVSAGERQTIDLSKQVTLTELIKAGLTGSPSIAIKHAEWKAIVERYPQAKALQDPILRYDYFGESVETRVGPQVQRLMISQSFPFPGTLKTKAKLAATDIAIKQLEYDLAVREFIVKLKVIYYEIVYLQSAIEISKQNQQLLSHFAKEAKTEYAKGSLNLNSLLKAETQAAQIQYDIVLLTELKTLELSKLYLLVNLSEKSKLGSFKMDALRLQKRSYKDYEKLAQNNRQEIKVATLKLEKAEKKIKLATLKTRPKFTLFSSYVETDEAEMPVADSGKDPWTVGIGFTIPIWYSKNKAVRREAKYMRQKAANEKVLVENKTSLQLKTLLFKLRNSRRLITLYDKTLIPHAKHALDISENKEKSAKKDLSQLVETQGIWLNFNLARLRAVIDYQQTLAKLESLTAVSLTKERK